MKSLDGVFDTSGTVRRPAFGALPREFTAFLTYRPGAADMAGIPHGAGHTVLVLPGLLTTDAFTLRLRRFLGACGYRAEGWELGTNWGPTPRLLAGLEERLRRLNDREGGPVSVVGVSMGGILARNLAHDHPGRIRKLATMVSPVRFPTASSLEPLVRLLSPFYSDGVSTERYGGAPPVPTMALYTRGDGLIAWETCQGAEGECHEVEVEGGHATICRNPQALRAVAQWLGQPL
ncbi:alpha/beta hydrolase [Iodidimonas sp. SYSU 1G8]|uniref:esterase/lipase family protein n=1 Tax=Iodidimonas sp. SYSU 1G8 TaxID=3133967 RepID=UPI0031FEB361